MATITDGTSHTLVMGDKHVRRTTKWGHNEDRTIYSSQNSNNYRRFAGMSCVRARSSASTACG